MDLEQAYDELLLLEPSFRPVYDRIGPVDPFRWPALDVLSGRFAPLVFHIAGQQISTAAAESIFNRLSDHVGGDLDAERVSRITPEQLRALGFSNRKAAYILGLAEAQRDDAIDLERIHQYSDDDVVEQLTALPGIGLWTAQMFLIFQLRRPDVFPAADLVIRHGMERLWELDSSPTLREATLRAQPWSPYRSFAAALLWRATEPVAP